MQGWILRFAVVLSLLVALLLAGCAGTGTNSTPVGSPIRVQLTTPTVNLAPGATHPFAATVTGTANTNVSWSVVGGASNGAIDQSGIYTAPSEAGTYTVVAASSADPGITARGTVRVQTGVNITIAPQNQTLRLGDLLQFTATVTGSGDPNVTWGVQGSGAGGTISPTGLYTAPFTPGTYTVSARPDADPTTTVTTQVIVIAGVETKIDFPTRELITIPASTVKFTGRAVGNTNQNITWSVQGGASSGTITADGTWTAPATPGVYTVVATSVADPTKTATRTVKVVSTARVRLTIKDRGDVIVQLNTAAAPNTTANFVSLVNANFYPGIKIHRVESNLIQGGDPLTRTLPIDDPTIGTGGPGYTIPLENTGISHLRGVISMARRADPDTAGSQFFIMKDDFPGFDGEYASFGEVETGLSVVDAIIVGDEILAAEVIE